MDDHQLLRYSRQILLPQIDIKGQTALLEARVLIIGLGGLGSPAAMYLASAGIGTLLINDYDHVDLSNLQRQILHSTDNVGESKTASALKTLKKLNPDIIIETIDHQLEGSELDSIINSVHAVLDCTDNFGTRFAVNAACVKAQKPLVSGAVIRFEGQLAVFRPDLPDGPCYNCLYAVQGELAETCSRSGVIAPLPGIVGSLQALETIKLLLGLGQPQQGALHLFDGLSMEWRRITLRRNPACPTCGNSR